MKNNFHLILLIIPLLAISCGDEVPLRTPQDVFEQPQNLKFEKIIQQAVNARAEYYPESDSRATVSKPTIDFIVDTQSRSENPDTLIYVVNFPNNEGYALIGNGCKENKLLAIVPEGEYDENSKDKNLGLAFFLDCAENYVLSDDIGGGFEKFDSTLLIPVTKTVVDTAYYYHLPPQLGEIEWGQGGIYGKYCPNYNTGCAPLAIGTLIIRIAAWRVLEPQMKFTFPERIISEPTISWVRMLRHKREAQDSEIFNYHVDEICYSSDKEVCHTNIGHVLRQIGYELKADYSDPFETKTTPESYKSILKKYLPEMVISDFTKYDNTQASFKIDCGYMLLRASTGTGYGHVWIADGYHKCKYTTSIYDRGLSYGNGQYSWILRSQKTTVESLVHMNWGYDGRDNGYYSDDVIVRGTISKMTYSNIQYISVTTK